MRNIPWKSIAYGCGLLTLLVVIRSIITAGRFVYYGGTYWQQEVFSDPWFYIGMVAAAVCVAALLAMASHNLKDLSEDNEDGRGE